MALDINKIIMESIDSTINEGASDDLKKDVKDIGEKYVEVGKSAVSAAKNVPGAIKEAGEKVASGTSDAVDSIRKKAIKSLGGVDGTDVAGAAKNVGAKALEKTAEVAKEAGEKANDAISNVAEKAKDSGTEAVDAIKNAGSKVVTAASDKAEDIKDAVVGAGKTAISAAKENPGTASALIGAALAAGAGALALRKRMKRVKRGE